MKKKFWILIVSVMLVIAMMTVVITAEIFPTEEKIVDDAQNEDVSVYQKIHFYFGNAKFNTIDSVVELKEATETLKASDSRKAAKTDSLGSVPQLEMIVGFESDFMSTPEYLAFSAERAQLKTSEDVLAFRKKLNAFSKEYHNNLVKSQLHQLSAVSYEKIVMIDYSPFVVMYVSASTLDAERLSSLAKSDAISTISIGYKPEVHSDYSWNVTMQATNAYEIIQNETYTGEGVRIGIYESGGVCDVNHTNISWADITKRNANASIQEHATSVTSILTLMAPDAKFFVSEVYQYGVSWFISQNCDIVNCSFSYLLATDENGDGIYEPESGAYHAGIDGIYDYQVAAHFITVVKSAGNISTDNTEVTYNPNGVVCSPGKAYNVLTVGGLEYAYIDEIEQHQWVYAEGACYRCPVTMKPNVSAAYYISIPNISSEFRGTSAATPIVAGAVAFLMEKDALYFTNPQMVMSALTASADETYDYTSSSSNAFDNYVGAGALNAGDAIQSNLFYSRVVTDTTALYESTEQAVYLVSGDSLQVAFAWLATAFDSNDAAVPTDFELYVYDPQGNLVGSSTIYRTMVEMIKIEANTTGTYRVVAQQDGSWSAATSGIPVSFYMNRIRP